MAIEVLKLSGPPLTSILVGRQSSEKLPLLETPRPRPLAQRPYPSLRPANRPPKPWRSESDREVVVLPGTSAVLSAEVSTMRDLSFSSLI